MSNDPIPTMIVKVRDERTEKESWGYGRGGTVIRTVTIPAFCPRCGGPRGEVRGNLSCYDGEWSHLNIWDNPCGHVDWYERVLIESGFHPDPDSHIKRAVQFPDGEIIRVYKVLQSEWRPGMTEAECGELASAEVWAKPTNRTDVGSAGQEKATK